MAVFMGSVNFGAIGIINNEYNKNIMNLTVKFMIIQSHAKKI